MRERDVYIVKILVCAKNGHQNVVALVDEFHRWKAMIIIVFVSSTLSIFSSKKIFHSFSSAQIDILTSVNRLITTNIKKNSCIIQFPFSVFIIFFYLNETIPFYIFKTHKFCLFSSFSFFRFLDNVMCVGDCMYNIEYRIYICFFYLSCLIITSNMHFNYGKVNPQILLFNFIVFFVVVY